MASQRINTTNYFVNRTDAVEFVKGLLQYSENLSALTTTIEPAESGAYCVHSVIDISLDDTEMQDYLKQQLNILRMKQTYTSQRENEERETGERNEL